MYQFLLASVILGGVAAHAQSPKANVTFHKDVLPILQTRCQGCHRPGEIGSMPLQTFAQTRPFAKAILSPLRGCRRAAGAARWRRSVRPSTGPRRPWRARGAAQRAPLRFQLAA